MTYREAIQYLYNLRLFGTKLGLDHTRDLAARFGSPQTGLRFIHVAGTNGKGSVCAMLESIYRATGWRVGLFTSPHLVSFGERIQINRQPIPEETVARLVRELQSVLGSLSPAAHPTFFEVVTVMALRYFAEAGCELVVWETGLGGRLDATNIVTPLASVITNIGYDHQRWLGEEIAQIAQEKAGIIKPGVPAVTATTQPEALAVLRKEAQYQKAPLVHVPEADIQMPFLRSITLPLAGIHQQWNAALACAVTRVLADILPLSELHLRQGLERVYWPGRLQTVPLEAGRTLLLDGAHNPPGFEVLGRFLDTTWPEPKPAIVLGVLEDKDWREMAKIIMPRAGRLCLVPVKSLRSARPEILRPIFQKENPRIYVTACPSLDAAWAQLQQENRILITGSIYLIGEAMEFFGLSSVKPQDEKGLNEWGDPAPAVADPDRPDGLGLREAGRDGQGRLGD